MPRRPAVAAARRFQDDSTVSNYSPMGIAADLVLLVHAAFVAFVVLGGLLAFRWPRIIWVHAPAAIWGVAVEWAGYVCPLTPLEVALRERAGQLGYPGGFIEHYLESLLYPTGLTREFQIALGACVLLVNVMVYWRLMARRARGEPHAHARA